MDRERPDHSGKRGLNDAIPDGGSQDQAAHHYITSPIYYVNGKPHLGHLYTSTAVDICGKFRQICGEPVFTSFGVDEHGQKIEAVAIQNGMTPQDYVDQAYRPFVDLLNLAKIEPSCFIRTTDDKHKKVALHLWKLLEKADLIYEGEYAGWYAKNDEAFYKEAEVENGISKITGAPVEWITEKCFFFQG